MPRWVRVSVTVVAVLVTAAVRLAGGEWWPAPVVAAAAIVAVSAYGWLRPVRGVRAVRTHAGGLALVGPGGGERVLPWGVIEATEHSPGRRGVCERARIWLLGVDEPVELVHVRRLEALVRELDEHLSPAFGAALHERLQAEGSVRLAGGGLTVRAGGLVHRPPAPLSGTEAFRWTEVRSARASAHDELEVRTRSAGLPWTVPVANARVGAEFIEEVRQGRR